MLLDETVIDMESKDFIRRDEQNGFLLKENIKNLGKNNLRNFDSMRTFLAKYFFDYNRSSPLDSFKSYFSSI